ncbi:MAG: isoaspartyl peptidase/L-asparaginase [Chromatiales bacterium]|nr:isoaspartyl peptidase/L-asparaginase [Chromatiales bacterium]
MSQPALIIHGGAGAREGSHTTYASYAQSLRRILASAWQTLSAGDAREAVLTAVRALEDDPIFNAGLGSRLQRDGTARMSAALMDGDNGSFSGVINIERVRHPIDVADALHAERHRVLAGAHASRYARDAGLADFDPVTPHRRAEHEQQLAGEHGTVGAVALDGEGRIWAGTSTGGVGFEIPGRVSDSATVAGTYADGGVGVSCTGIGEHIVDHAGAARIATRVIDGLDLEAAIQRTLDEADARSFEYGLIALDRGGLALAGSTHGVTTLWAARDSHGSRDFVDASA